MCSVTSEGRVADHPVRKRDRHQHDVAQSKVGAKEADEAKRLEEETLRRERMTPAAKGGMQFVASAKRYGRHGSLTNPDDLVEETPMGGALVDYGTPQHAESDVYAATPVGEAAEGRIAEAVVEAC